MQGSFDDLSTGKRACWIEFKVLVVECMALLIDCRAVLIDRM